MENAEEEESIPDIKEKIPVSGKKHGVLAWKLQKDQKNKKKEDNEESEDISMEKFELEAKKLSQKYIQHTQRKEQEISKVSSTTYDMQPGIVAEPLKARRIEVMPRDPGNHELKWNEIGLHSDEEDDHPYWSALTSMNRDINNNRPAVNSKNCIMPAILSKNCAYKRNISRRAATSKSLNKNTERAMALQDIDCEDGIQRPVVGLEIHDSSHKLSSTAVKTNKRDDEEIASRPAVSSVDNCDSDQSIARPVVGSLNLTKNFKKGEKHRRRGRPKELRKARPGRTRRTKSNRKYEEYFLDETDSEGREDDIDEKEFSLKTELTLQTAKHFNRWSKQKVESEKPSETEKDEQPESDLAKWVFDVLSISKVINNQAICEQITTRNSLLLDDELPGQDQEELELEEDEIPVINPEQEDAFNEYSRFDPDPTSMPFQGSTEQIPVSNVLQTLPNMVPRDEPEKKPIRHQHYISNEPITDDEDDMDNDGIMGMTSRLIGKAMRSSNKNTEVKPFRRAENVRKELKEDDFQDEAPAGRWPEDLISEYNSIITALRY